MGTIYKIVFQTFTRASIESFQLKYMFEKFTSDFVKSLQRLRCSAFPTSFPGPGNEVGAFLKTLQVEIFTQFWKFFRTVILPRFLPGDKNTMHQMKEYIEVYVFVIVILPNIVVYVSLTNIQQYIWQYKTPNLAIYIQSALKSLQGGTYC